MELTHPSMLLEKELELLNISKDNLSCPWLTPHTDTSVGKSHFSFLFFSPRHAGFWKIDLRFFSQFCPTVYLSFTHFNKICVLKSGVGKIIYFLPCK